MGWQESPTTGMVLARCNRAAMGSDDVMGARRLNFCVLLLASYFLLACSSFCLYIFSASLRTVSETSLLAEIFFRSADNRCFIRPRPRSRGVRGFATRLRTTL